MDVILYLLFFTFLSVLLDVYFFQILKNVIKLNALYQIDGSRRFFANLLNKNNFMHIWIITLKK